jgi:hypothetical protein
MARMLAYEPAKSKKVLLTKDLGSEELVQL